MRALAVLATMTNEPSRWRLRSERRGDSMTVYVWKLESQFMCASLFLRTLRQPECSYTRRNDRCCRSSILEFHHRYLRDFLSKARPLNRFARECSSRIEIRPAQ